MIRRWLVKGAVVGVIAVLSIVGLTSAIIANSGRDRVFDDVSAVPAKSVVIVPGAGVFPGGRPSLTLQDRLDGAVAIVSAGKAERALVSGDNRTAEYNEPVAMRNALVDAGLDAQLVTLDYAGLDTWDTCVRAAEQFGVTDAVVVTQARYAERTAALCARAGIDVAVLAVDPPAFQRRRTKVLRQTREIAAKIKTVADMAMRPEPAHGGPFIGLVGSADMPDGGHPPDWDWSIDRTAAVADD